MYDWRQKVGDALLLASLVKINEEDEDNDDLLKTVTRVTTTKIQNQIYSKQCHLL